MPVLPRRLAFYEMFEQVAVLKTHEERVAKLRDLGNKNIMVKQLVNMCYHPKIKWMLPEGKIPDDAYKHAEKEEDEGALTLRLSMEFRTLPNFLNVGPYPKMHPNQRERLFIALLEKLHPKDVTLICSIKDKKMPFENLTKELAEEAFPDLKDKWLKETPKDQIQPVVKAPTPPAPAESKEPFPVEVVPPKKKRGRPPKKKDVANG